MIRRVVATAVVAAVSSLALGGPVWAADATKGKATYNQFCVTCHGTAGKGDGPGAAALTPKPRNFTDKAYMGKLQDDYLVDVIKKGGAAVGKSALMPPWGAALKDDDVKNVVAFLRSLAK